MQNARCRTDGVIPSVELIHLYATKGWPRRDINNFFLKEGGKLITNLDSELFQEIAQKHETKRIGVYHAGVRACVVVCHSSILLARRLAAGYK